MVEVRRVTDRIMTIKLVIGGSTLNIFSAYAPQKGFNEEEKMNFWEVLDEVVRGVPSSEKIFIGRVIECCVETVRSFLVRIFRPSISFWC